MSLVIWCKDSRAKVLTTLAPVLAGFQGLDIKVVNDVTTPPKVQGAVVILALGNDPKLTMEAMKVTPKGRTTTSLRGGYFGHESLGCPIMFSYSPGIADMDYGRYVDLLTDVGTACRFAKTGSKHAVLGEYKYVDDFREVIARVEQLYAETGKPVESTLDLETVGLDPYKLPEEGHPGAYIVTVQLSVEIGKSYVLRFASKAKEEIGFTDMELLEQLAWILSTDKISMGGANLKFDLHWIAVRAKLECTNFKFDTTLVGSLLDENRSNGLDVHVKIYAPELGGYSDEFDKKIDKSRMDLVPVDTMLPYAGGDTDGCLRVRKQMKADLLKDRRLAGFYVNILHPSARAFEMVERGGVMVDMDAYKELESDLHKELDTLTTAARSIIGGRIVAKHHDPDKRGGLNLTKASLLVDFMFSPMGLNLKPQMTTEKSGAPSTALEHLMMFKDVPEAKEFVGLLKNYSSATKTLQTYVHGFQKHIRSDGNFHPSYYFFAGNKDEGEGGTNTGRLSCKDPAFQCLKGDSQVTTSQGLQSIADIVDGYAKGREFKVLTHTGKWKPVVGVYKNGVRPVFDVRFGTGKIVTSTENHPYLTSRGWVRTDQLKPGDICYELRTPNEGLHQPNVLQLDSNEESLHKSDQQRLATVRGQRDQGLREVGEVLQLSSGHGGEACCGVECGAQGCERGLRTPELRVGAAEKASEQSHQQQEDHPQRSNEDRSRVGIRGGDQSGTVALSALCGDVDGASLDEGYPWDRSVFQEVEVVSITPAGECETFDLTIQDSHSFVANGVIVHNTIPKHTKWAKKLRRCFPAPPGMLVLENDYSQGELRVIACLANEETMIEAYRQNMDLHVITSGRFAGYSYEDMMKLKKENKELFDSIRQLGKAGNFGLIYGMGAEGFQAYAEGNYGVKLALEEAAKFRNGFFETYHKLPVYHKDYKAFAKKNGYVVSPLGRMRHLPLINSVKGDVRATAERQSINSPVQGCLSDMLIWAISISHQRGWFESSPCFGAIHDAKYTYIPEDNHEFYIERELEVMESLPFEKVGWKPQLVFTADAKFGKTMADLKEYERKKA